MEKYFTINDAGCSVKCKLYYTGRIETVIFAAHGFAGNKESNAFHRFAEKVLPKYKNSALLCFDLPCHGEDNSPKLTLERCDTYFTLVLNYIRSLPDVKRVFATAISFGGYLTLKYIHEHGCPFEKVALRCPALVMHWLLLNVVMSEDERQKLGHAKELSVGFAKKVRITKAFVDELGENDITKLDFSDYMDTVFIAHGTADEVVPYEPVRDFADNNGIDLLSVEGADHRFTDPKKLEKALNEFIAFFGL